MVRSLSDDYIVALETIKYQYMMLHPKTYEIDMQMAEDFLVGGMYVKDIADKYHYHENTVHNKISMVQAFIETFYDYEYVSLPNYLMIDIGNLNPYSYKLILMAISKYQCMDICVINRRDIVSRFPYLSHNKQMQAIVSEMRNSTAQFTPLIRHTKEHLTTHVTGSFPVFESLKYSESRLSYKFSETLNHLLQIGKHALVTFNGETKLND